MSETYTRHDDHPPIETRPAEIPAECYNCAKLVLMRSEPWGPVWLDLPGLRSLKLALLPKAWVVADWRMGKMPLMAWTDFCTEDRKLHGPVPCKHKIYMGSADRKLDSTMAIMRRQLRAHLRHDGGSAEVVGIHGAMEPKP